MLETIGIIISIIVGLIAIWGFLFKKKKFSLKPYLFPAKPLEEYWVGRKNELDQLTGWYKDNAVRVISLVAFGGVGKSALAQKWLEGLNTDRVFWWYFYRKPSLDAFLEAALNYCSGGQFNLEEAKSPYVRVRKLLEYITNGRFILVLDGLEDMQKARDKGMHFGEMKDRDFTELLQLWAEGDHRSLLLITTRYSLKDLEFYEEKSYCSLSLEHLLPEDARQLMRKRRVKGKDEALDKVARDYDYHALSLKLISGYLDKFFKGDIACAPKIPFNVIETDEKVEKILIAYGDKLDEAQCAFMDIFSTFRQQVEEDAFATVFGQQIEEFDFKQMLGHLVNLGLISEDEHTQQVTYSTHPLIRQYYYNQLPENQRIAIHKQVAGYYEAKGHPQPKTLDDLSNAIEAFHHTIKTKDYEQADSIYNEKINIQDAARNKLMTHNLGVFELNLSLISQLFLGGNTGQEPLITSADRKAWLINEVGFCLMMMGRLAEAVPFFQRYIKMCLANKDWANASVGSQNLCDIQLRLGKLAAGENAARKALNWAKQAKHKRQERNSLAYLAYATFLQGEHKKATEWFEQAHKLEQDISGKQWLYSVPGIFYAEFLACQGQTELAQEVTQENLIICQRNHWPNSIARCYRLLARVCLERKDYTQAEEYLNNGLQIARNIGFQEEIAQLYLGFAKLHLRQNELPQAHADLKEVFRICTNCGYKLFEIDAHNVLAQILIAEKKVKAARHAAQTAYDMSQTCGYYWGMQDAQEILNRDYS